MSELSEDAAKYLAEEFGEELTEALAKAEVIGPFRVMRHFTAKHGRTWQAHHIYEAAKMKGIRLDPLDGPAVILSKEVHQRFTTELAAATGRVDAFMVRQLWNKYKDVYAKHPEWLKAIAHYFAE